MKRHPELMPLSRDHHHALVLARTLRRATEDTRRDAADAFIAHWDGEERHHFRVEEEVLLPAYAAHGDPGHPVITRMLQDHILIRRDAERLRADTSLELLRQLGERLAEHVKLEEEHVFPLIEATLPEAAMAALGERLRHAGAR